MTSEEVTISNLTTENSTNQMTVTLKIMVTSQRLFSDIWPNTVQFGKTNLLYIFNGESLTICNNVTISNK